MDKKEVIEHLMNHQPSTELIKHLFSQEENKYSIFTEILHGIHNIYSSNSYCKEDKCMKETYGYNCDDCLYQSIQALIWQLKFNNATKETNSPKEEARKKKEEAIIPIKEAKEEEQLTEGDIKIAN